MWFDTFSAHCVKEFPREACGLLVDGNFIPCPNTHEEPTKHFRIDPLHYAKASAMGKVEAILHSHPYNKFNPPRWPAEWPTTADMNGYFSTAVPWGIVACDGEGITQPVWLKDEPEPLVGREFIHGINDCYSLIRDWFRLERGIVLKDFARGMEWWLNSANLYEDNFQAAGFSEVDQAEATIGDVVLIKYMSPVINHGGVITGTNELLHHQFHRLSGHDRLDKWSRKIEKVVRFTGETA